jgi:hypothetical protein
MPTATLQDVLVADLTKDVITRLDSLIKATEVIEDRSEGETISDALSHLRCAAVELRCHLIEVTA